MVSRKKILSFMLFVFLAMQLPATTIDSEVAKARAAEGKAVVRCSPDGKNGGLPPAKAVSKLKDGMTLLLMPGKYSSSIEIFSNKIIVTSDSRKLCRATVKLSGRDCVVKNIRLDHLYTKRDTVLVDSIVSFYSCGYWNSKKSEKVDVFIYNTGVGEFSCSSFNNTIVDMKNCVINGAIECNSCLRLNIEDSILYSKNTLFQFSNYENRQGRVTLKNNLLYAVNGLGKIVYSESVRKGLTVAATLNNLKRLWNIVLSGNNRVQAPKFLKNNHYFQAASSPGEGVGLIVDEHPLRPVATDEKVADRPKTKKTSPSGKPVKPNIKPIRKKEEEIGGIPKPPQ